MNRLSFKRTGRALELSLASCRHFTGHARKVCAKGHCYDGLWARGTRLPCSPPLPSQKDLPVIQCDDFEKNTQEIIDREDEEFAKAASQMMDLLAQGKCPSCKEALETKRVGRCKYCVACGYRIGQ